MKAINLCSELGIGKENIRWKGLEEDNPSVNPKNQFGQKSLHPTQNKMTGGIKGHKNL